MHLWDWGAHKTPGTRRLTLPYIIYRHTCGNTVQTPLPQKRVADYYTLMLHMIWFSNIQVSFCEFFLNWNQSACLFPNFVNHFSIGKKNFFFFFATQSPSLIKSVHSHRPFESKYYIHLAPLDMMKTCSSKSTPSYFRITHFLNRGSSFSYHTPCSWAEWENSAP